MSGLTGLVAAVTGGASGIGLATVRSLRAAGARVASLDLQPSPDADFSAIADVRDQASIGRAVEQLVAELGGLDIVVNSAGVSAVGTVLDNSDEEWRQVLDVNVVGIVRVSRAVIPLLRESSNAAIVNLCSIASSMGLPDRALYSATKGAVEALTRAMAADHLHEGIRVNCVSPATADTPWVERLLAETPDATAARAALEARQPTGRLVRAEEIAHFIVALVSPEASAVTGTVLPVDSGTHSLLLPQRQSTPAG